MEEHAEQARSLYSLPRVYGIWSQIHDFLSMIYTRNKNIYLDGKLAMLLAALMDT